MDRRIIALVKKDFRFSGNYLMAVLTFPTVYYAGTWAEYTFAHVVEEQDGFIICLIIVGLSTLPLTHSFKREQGPSTRQFLSTLPVRTGEIYIANMIAMFLYMVLLAAMVLLGSRIFGTPCDVQFLLAAMSMGIFYNSVYILIYYMVSFNVSQVFLIGSIMIPMMFVGGFDINLSTLGFFSDLHITLPACIAMVAAAICIIALLCKLKRRIL